MKKYKFHIGQRVVCLYSVFTPDSYSVVKGREYIILDMFECKCGDVFVDVGITLSHNISIVFVIAENLCPEEQYG